jgi:hypothetical protein
LNLTGFEIPEEFKEILPLSLASQLYVAQMVRSSKKQKSLAKPNSSPYNYTSSSSNSSSEFIRGLKSWNEAEMMNNKGKRIFLCRSSPQQRLHRALWRVKTYIDMKN